MNEDSLLAALSDFVEGKRPLEEWAAFWLAHTDEIKKAVTAGEFLRLKPRTAGGRSDVLAFARSLEEMRKVLAKRGVTPIQPDSVTARIKTEQIAFDKEVTFGSKILGIAMREFYASVPNEDSKRWYAEYSASDGADEMKWIRDRLEKAIQWIFMPPKWIGEPEWPWLDGVPMVFVGQVSAGQSPPREAALSPGEVLYTFALRVQNTCEIRTVTQIPGIS